MDNGYQRVKVIGKGAYGAAILVRKGSDLFVRKEVNLQGLSTKEKLEAEHEAAVLKSLSHRYIIRYMDSGVTHGKLWIVMAYACGGDLDVYVQKKKAARMRFELEEALVIFSQICLALNYLHGKKILHRDLKSKNIFLDKKLGNSAIPFVKLGDFGISKVLQNTREQARTQIGTPYYLSPEICQDQPYSFRSDVWAVGIILFEMLALRVPFEARDLRALVTKIVKSPVPKLPGKFQSNSELQELLHRLLAKSPMERPDISEVLNHSLVRDAVTQLHELDSGANIAGLQRTFTKPNSMDIHRKVAQENHLPIIPTKDDNNSENSDRNHHHQPQAKKQNSNIEHRQKNDIKSRQADIAKERARCFREFKAQLQTKQRNQGRRAVIEPSIHWLGNQSHQTDSYHPDFESREPTRDSQQELQQSRPDTRASNSRAEIRQRHMEQKRAGQADAQYVMAQLGRAAPMSYRPSQQNVEKPPWEIRRQSKEGGNLVQAAAIQRARRLRALTADTEERKRIFRMRSSPEILEAPDSRRSQHLNDEDMADIRNPSKNYDAQAAAREAYLERQRQAMENARRINADLGRAYKPIQAPSLVQPTLEHNHRFNHRVPAAQHSHAAASQGEPESHAERLKRLREVRKLKEIREHEMALEDARRQAFVDRAVAQSRLQQERGEVVDGDVDHGLSHPHNKHYVNNEVQYLDIAPLDLHKLYNQDKEELAPNHYNIDPNNGDFHDELSPSERREENRHIEQKSREEELAEARRQHFQDIQKLRRKVANLQLVQQ